MKKFLCVVFMAFVIGGGLAYFVFSRENLDKNDEMILVKAFQVGAFTNYDNALRVADRNNGIVVSDEDVYRVYVAILNDDSVIAKMKKYYDEIGLHYYLKEISVSKKFLNNIKETEELLVDSNVEAYKVINLSILSKYEEML